MKTIKLLRTKRYFYKDTLYVLGKKYTLKNDIADALLAETDASDLPVFVETSADTEEVQRKARIKAADRSEPRRREATEDEDYDSAREEGVVV